MTDETKSPIDSGESVEPTDDYQVGYKSPPKHTRFQKGVSGNPRGRRKRDGNLRRYLDNFMAENQATSSEIEMSKREAFVRTQIESARRGNSRQFKTFLKNARKAKLFDAPGDEVPRNGVVTYKQDVSTALAQLEAVRAQRREVLAKVVRGELKEIDDD